MRHDVIIIIRQVVVTGIIAVHETILAAVGVGVLVEIRTRKRGNNGIVRVTIDVVTW
jgi:hypothetical protein